MVSGDGIARIGIDELGAFVEAIDRVAAERGLGGVVVMMVKNFSLVGPGVSTTPRFTGEVEVTVDDQAERIVNES